VILGLLVGVMVIAGTILYFIGNARLNKTYDFPPSNLRLPTDAVGVQYGKERTEFFCTRCHGDNLGGLVNWRDLGALGTIDATNLTSGDGGIGREYTSDEDWVRAIRHGIDPEGKPIYMPAVLSTSHISDQELSAIIAYIKTVPPVDHRTDGYQFTPLGKIILALGLAPPPPVETVSHDVHVAAPDPGLTREYGKYMVDILECRLCHGQELVGGRYPDPTIKIQVPDITSTGEVFYWSEDQFIDTIRNGITPGGHELNPKLMPWERISMKTTDEDLKAVYLYLHSLPVLELDAR